MENNKHAEQMIKIAILISADAEWNVITNIHKECEVLESPLGQYFQSSLNLNGTSQPIIYYHGGWGKISAAATTQYVIQRWNPRLIINIGTCGGFANKVNKFDIILVEKTVVYDICERAGNNDEHIEHYTTEFDLSWLTNTPLNDLRKGIIVSADQDLDGNAIPNLIQKYDAVAADWESGAIAYVCRKSRTKCLILRGVSDIVDETGSEIYKNNDTYIQSTEIVMQKLVNLLPDFLFASFDN